ncbi:hypothetical protein [Capnocytophaga felis]|uniref:hypothetical protein n=1 Tax=Capnocytophaga felis TaxID=2267611 RepID=UPI0015655575|nr:hypothetical protein [Capnocytophaga felis]
MKRTKNQGFGYYAKNQFSHTPLSRTLLKISKLAPYGRFGQWRFSTLHSLIFLTLHLQCHQEIFRM